MDDGLSSLISRKPHAQSPSSHFTPFPAPLLTIHVSCACFPGFTRDVGPTSQSSAMCIPYALFLRSGRRCCRSPRARVGQHTRKGSAALHPERGWRVTFRSCSPHHRPNLPLTDLTGVGTKNAKGREGVFFGKDATANSIHHVRTCHGLINRPFTGHRCASSMSLTTVDASDLPNQSQIRIVMDR